MRAAWKDGKGNKDRYVLIDPETADLLSSFTHARSLESPLFDIEDRQINYRVVKWGEATIYEAQDRAFTSHSLRHCFATHMYEAGAQLLTIKELLGHEYLSTTEVYIAVGVGKLQSDYQSFHPLARREG